MKVRELIRELEAFNQEGEVAILLPDVINGKNGAEIYKIDKFRTAEDKPGVMLVSKLHDEPQRMREQ